MTVYTLLLSIFAILGVFAFVGLIVFAAVAFASDEKAKESMRDLFSR